MKIYRAQIAANQNGIGLLHELVDSYSLPVVQAYMEHIQQVNLVIFNVINQLNFKKNILN
jgi:N-methylhydantoinase B/oxoprolinase/acetone carboxylase alpha subunit